MQNPWVNLPLDAPYVLDCDKSAITEFNSRVVERPEFCYQTQLLPEPFFGDPNAPVYLLTLNPGYDEIDDVWHRNEDFIISVRKTHRHDTDHTPFYYLDSRRFKPLPKSIQESGYFESIEYSLRLVGNAIAQDKTIIMMRSYRDWCAALPELADYRKLFRLNSSLNVSLTPNNLKEYDLLEAELRR